MVDKEVVTERRRLVLSLLLLGVFGVLSAVAVVPTYAVDDGSVNVLLTSSETGADSDHTWTMFTNSSAPDRSLDTVVLNYSGTGVGINTANVSASTVGVRINGVSQSVGTVNVSGSELIIDLANATTVAGGDYLNVSTDMGGLAFTNPSSMGEYTAEVRLEDSNGDFTFDPATASFTVGTGIAGTVENEAGTPLENAQVEVIEAGVQTTTDANGDYSIQVSSGTYDVRFQKPGYINVTYHNISVTTNNVRQLDLTGFLAMTGSTTVDQPVLSDTSPDATGVTYDISFSPDSPIYNVSYISLNVTRAGDASLDGVVSSNVTFAVDGDQSVYNGIYSVTSDRLTIETTTPLDLDGSNSLTLSVDNVTNPSVGGEYPVVLEIHEENVSSNEPFPPKTGGFTSFQIDEPSGVVDLETEIYANQNGINVSTDFNNVSNGEAFLVVRNTRTGNESTQTVTQPGTVEALSTDLGGLQKGDEIVAGLYDSNARSNLIASDGNVVGPPLYQISSCTTITESAIYVLGSDLFGVTTDNCIDIQANNVTFDGQGHEISSGGAGGSGVRVGPVQNVEVGNVTVTDWTTLDAGIYANGTQGLYVHNVNASGGTFGIRTRNVSDFGIEDSKARRNERAGIQISDSTNGGIRNITADENALISGWTSVYVRGSSSGITLENVTASNSPDGGNGVSVTGGTSSITVAGSTAVNNDGSGFRFLTDAVTVFDITAIDNTWDVTIRGGTGLAIDGLSVGPSTASDTTMTFIGQNMRLRGVDSPPANAEATSIDRYVELGEVKFEGVPTFGYFNVDMMYQDGDVGGAVESDLRFWNTTGSAWEKVDASTVDTAANVVSYEFTSAGTVGIFAEGAPGELAFDPSEVVIDDGVVGSEVGGELSVENVGNEEAAVENVRIEGPDADLFSVSDTTFTLAPGESLALTVSFSAQAEGTYQAELVFEGPGGVERARVPLEGTATEQSAGSGSTGGGGGGGQDDDDDDDSEDDEDDSEDDDDEEETTVQSEGESTDTGASVQSSVQNANAGERVGIEVPDPQEDQSFEVDEVALTPAQDGDFTLDIEASSEPLDSTPDAEYPFDGTEELGYVSVEASVDNADIEQSEFTFRVDEETIEGTEAGPEDVAMFQYDEELGRFVERPTEFLGREDGKLILQTVGDGFSDWTAAAKTPELNITDTEIDVAVATTDEDVTIQVFVTNTGGADGTYEAQLLANGEIIDREDATVPANRTVIIDFVRTFDQPDLYEVQVNDVRVGQINITEDENVTVSTPTPTDDDDAEGGGADGEDGTSEGTDQDSSTGEGSDEATNEETEEDDGGVLDSFGPGFNIVTAILAILLGGSLYIWRREGDQRS